MLSELCKSPTAGQVPTNIDTVKIRDYLVTLGNASCMFSEIVTLLKIFPGSSATAESTFSALRRLKTYLRTAMGSERLNDLMMLHVHKELTDRIRTESFAKRFVEQK